MKNVSPPTGKSGTERIFISNPSTLARQLEKIYEAMLLGEKILAHSEVVMNFMALLHGSSSSVQLPLS